MRKVVKISGNNQVQLVDTRFFNQIIFIDFLQGIKPSAFF